MDQLRDIEHAQDAVRKGKLGKLIDSIEKSLDRAGNDLSKIKTLKDALDQFDGDDAESTEGQNESKNPPQQ